MKALFIVPNPYYAFGVNDATISPPLGLIYLSTILEKNGIESRVIDANMGHISNKDMLNTVSSEDPDVIGVSANVVTSRSAMELLKGLRSEFKNKLLISGGPVPTVLPEKFLELSDIVVRNEGEETILEILRNKNIEAIDGISFKKNGSIFHNKSRELIKDLNALPFPNYNLLTPELKKYKSRARKRPSAPILTSRGCPYQCIYCNKGIFGLKFRSRSPESVIGEIDFLVNNFGVKQIDIMDDNFTFDIANAEKICDMIIDRKYNLAINCNSGVRADRLTKDLVRKMKLAGVFKVGVGIESGNREVLAKIKKQLNLDNVIQAVKWFKEEGILTHGFFMIGLPYDTPQTMQDTIDFALKCDTDAASFAITMPYPGTELYKYIEENGKFLQNIEEGVASGFYAGDVFYETQTTKKEDVLKYYKKATKEFYLRPGKMFKILTQARSFSELSWVFDAGWGILRSLFSKAD